MSINSSFRKPEADLATQAASIGALADPVRRALYQYVAAQPDAVGREAAAAVHVPMHTAKFHLDRLPYGRQEDWQDSPEGWPQSPTYSRWVGSQDIAALYGEDA